MRQAQTFALITLGLALAGCGGTSATTGSAPTPTAPVSPTSTPAPTSTTQATAASNPPAPVVRAAENAQQLAVRIGCTGFKAGVAPLATSYGNCTFHGAPVKVYVFRDPSLVPTFEAMVKSFGINPGQLAVEGAEMAAPGYGYGMVLAALRAAL
jgi:hypothetical protein